LSALAGSGELGDIVCGDGAYRSRHLGVACGGRASYPVSVGGKIDGMTRDGSALIEVKNRVNRLFNAASEYERVQCMCYLAIYPGAQKCVLAEGLRADGTLTVNLVDIARDETAWEATRRSILGVAHLVARVIEDPAMQDAYFASKTKTAFLKKRVHSAADRPVFSYTGLSTAMRDSSDGFSTMTCTDAPRTTIEPTASKDVPLTRSTRMSG
jgi:hypothetical protein